MSEELLALPAVQPVPRHERLRRGALGAWWAEGLRTALFMRPRWAGLQVAPATLGVLVLVAFGAAIGVERLYVTGAARFYWPALLADAAWLAVLAWICWVVAPPAPPAGDRAPGGAGLLSLLLAQSLPLTAAIALAMLPMGPGGLDAEQAFGLGGVWFFSLLPLVWTWAAQAAAVWRSAPVARRARLAASLSLAALTAVTMVAEGHFRHWYAAPQPGSGEADADRLVLTQELLELQPQLLADRLGALQPQRPKRIDVYAITFAPYAEGQVFRRESALVAGLMQQRFDAEGRIVQLVNHRDAAHDWPWATPLNLQRAIRQVAARMDREQDVLFIHLTSHGARSGELAADFWPLEVEPVTPAQLKAWLDEAGVRHRILSISACYSGSWVEPLAGPDTLVMTAADAENTSYGCGRRSELTFFGRAMYDEQLRETRSFEEAHARARAVIEQREKEAGKDDGYSNPQIAMGERLRPHLDALAAQLKDR